MICQECQGQRYVEPKSPFEEVQGTIPCPRCNGTGFEHCCEGERPDK